MALSYYTDMNIFNPTQSSTFSLPSELTVGCNNNNFTFQDSYNNIDYLSEPNDFSFSNYFDESYVSLFPNFPPFDQNPDPFSLLQEFDLDTFHSSKRQKLDSDYKNICCDEQFDFNGFLVPQLPDFPTPPTVYSNGSYDPTTNESSRNRETLSRQSIAARERRRKISEKTRELGKLIPGGEKMNTAEMFGAAYKYIKFLQAQVGILEFTKSHDDHQDEGEKVEGTGELLHGLLESSSVQEKLYSAEKCLVSQKIVQELTSDHQIWFKSEPQA